MCAGNACGTHLPPDIFPTGPDCSKPRLFLGSWFGDFPSLPFLRPGERRPVFKFRLGHRCSATVRLLANHTASLSLSFPIYTVGTRIALPALRTLGSCEVQGRKRLRLICYNEFDSDVCFRPILVQLDVEENLTVFAEVERQWEEPGCHWEAGRGRGKGRPAAISWADVPHAGFQRVSGLCQPALVTKLETCWSR